jgi:glutathione S-transferase
VLEWLNWLSGTVHGQAYGGLWRPQRFADDETLHPAITAKGRQTVADCYAMIDARLTGPHAVGDGLTAADAFLYVLYRWGVGIGLDMRGAYANFTRFAENLAQRPVASARACNRGAFSTGGVTLVRGMTEHDGSRSARSRRPHALCPDARRAHCA